MRIALRWLAWLAVSQLLAPVLLAMFYVACRWLIFWVFDKLFQEENCDGDYTRIAENLRGERRTEAGSAPSPAPVGRARHGGASGL